MRDVTVQLITDKLASPKAKARGDRPLDSATLPIPRPPQWLAAWGSESDNDLCVQVDNQLLEGDLVHDAGGGPVIPSDNDSPGSIISRRRLRPYYSEDCITLRTWRP